jgi:hypothetical protein
MLHVDVLDPQICQLLLEYSGLVDTNPLSSSMNDLNSVQMHRLLEITS